MLSENPCFPILLSRDLDATRLFAWRRRGPAPKAGRRECGGESHLSKAQWRPGAPLQYWNATNFRWSVPGSPAGPLFIKFEVSPDNTVTGLYFGLAGDVSLLNRKGGGRGGRGGSF